MWYIGEDGEKYHQLDIGIPLLDGNGDMIPSELCICGAWSAEECWCGSWCEHIDNDDVIY